MKRILLALLALGFVGNAQAQTSCAARLVAPFTPAEATKLCQEFSSAIGQSLIPSATNSFDLGSSTRTWRDLWLGRDLRISNTGQIVAPNLAANRTLAILSSFSDDNTYVSAYNDLVLRTNANTSLQERWRITTTGALVQNATNGGDIVFGNTSATIRQDTADASDNKSIIITGGGAAGPTRGAQISVTGNESGSSGSLLMQGGNTTVGHVVNRITNASAEVQMQNSSSVAMWRFGNTGNLTSDATNGGDLIFAGSGDTLSIQEATPASACMGVATPNGNTAVTVTTSCAVSGARVFYTRVGAVANMGVISTTTNPNGTSFQFASTSATDTLASSVVWLIVKEAA